MRRLFVLLREWFLLREARRLAEACDDAARAELRLLRDGVRERAKAAREAADEHYDAAALSLLGQALQLAATAVQIARGARPTGGALSRVELVELFDSGGLEGLAPTPDWSTLRELLATDDPTAADRNRATARSAIPSLTSALRRLERGFEVRTVRRLRVLRWVRIVGAVLLVMGLAAGMVGWLLTPDNVALGKPVTASSQRAGTPAALVDGIRTGAYGAHTQTDGKAWFTVDLMKPHRLSRVVVYNRGDGYWSEMLPLVLELSVDGKKFERARVREGTFTDSKPWRVGLKGEVARYVRLRVDRADAYIALNEIEVYGSPK